MKRYTDRVGKALNLSKEEFENFLMFLRSKDELSLQVALNMMRGQANATVKEMKAMFATYVVMPIFEKRRLVKQSISIKKYPKEYEYGEVAQFNHATYKAWVNVQLYYIKKFVQCSQNEMNRATNVFAVGLNSNVWAKYEDFDDEIVNAFAHLSKGFQTLYGSCYNYW